MTHQQPNQKPIRLTLAGESIVSPRRRRHLGVRPDPPHVWLEVGVSLLIALIGGLVVYGAAILFADLSDAHAAPVVQAMVPSPPPPVRDPVLTVLKSRLADDPHNEFLLWAAKVIPDKVQPYWKRAMATSTLMGNGGGTFTARTTFFQPHLPSNSHLDRQGGGPNPTWPIGRLLRDGDAAADNRYHRMGEVIFCRGRCRIIVDNGPAVKGAAHIDLCATSDAEYRRSDALNGKTAKAWVLGWLPAKWAAK